MAPLELIIEFTLLTLGVCYLYFKQSHGVRDWTRQDNTEKWTGHSIEASKLKPRVEQVRRDPLAAQRATKGGCFHHYLLGCARRAVLQLEYFRHREPEENARYH
jgi:hypothetical protein